MADPLALVSDVEDVWQPIPEADQPRIMNLIDVASAKLRQACPFNIDMRMALFKTTPSDPIALPPVMVANVVAVIVKRFLVNQNGVVTQSETTGPYTHSESFVNRYDKTGSDVRGAIQITPADIDELRPAVRVRVPQMVQLRPTRAMEPTPGYWPGGLPPRLDPVTGDPVFGLPVGAQLTDALNDFFQDGTNFMAYTPATMNVTQITGAPVPVSASGTLALGRETEVTGSAAVSLAFSATVNGSIAGVKVDETYTGTGVTVTGTFLGGATSFVMVAGQENKFTWNGTAILVS